MASTSNSASTSTLNNQEDGTSKNAKVILHEDIRSKLQGITSQINEKETNSKFLKIEANTSKILRFDPDQVEYVQVRYPSKGGSQSDPVSRVKFMLQECDGNGTVPQGREFIEWTASQTVGKQIITYLLKGFLTLEVAREGSTMQDTKYTITPFI